MKKCPNCQKTFDDNMKFCQSDGTPLVVVADNEPKADPYATMVANKSDLEIPPEEPKKEKVKEEPKIEVDPYATMVAPSQPVKKDKPKEDDGDLLDVLGDDKKKEEVDPMKTMIVSGNTADNIKVNIPEEKPKDKPIPTPPTAKPKEPIAKDLSEAKTMLSPDIPKFNEPKIDPPNLSDPIPKVEDKLPQPEVKKKTPSSPFEAEKPKVESKPEAAKPEDSKPTPIPSPFDASMPPGYSTPSTPPFEPPKEPLKPEPLNEPKKEEVPKSPFAEPKKPVVEANKKDWSPSNAPVANSGNQAVANNQFNSPIVSDTPNAEGQNQTFAIVSLVSGILSMLCCFSIITGPLAIVMGYLARNKAAENPNEFGGEKLALIGMILGGIGLLLFILVIILNFVGVFANQF